MCIGTNIKNTALHDVLVEEIIENSSVLRCVIV